MKARPTYALNPLSLAATALFRGSVALRHAHGRLHIPNQPCFAFPTVASSFASASPAADDAKSRAASAGDTGKPRRWEIPWGNHLPDKPNRRAREQQTLTRKLETLPGVTEKGVEGADSFRVMSFNILAQGMASSKMFPYVPKGQLRKGVRWPRVRDEVCRYGADIICLQECDAYDDVLASLNEQGNSQGNLFEGVYKRRTGKENGHGVAVLFDSKMLELVDSGSCEFGRKLFGGVGVFALLRDRRRNRNGTPSTPTPTASLRSPGAAKSEATAEPASDSIAVSAEAVKHHGGVRWEGGDAEAEGLVCVATTHLYWHPDGAAIRLAQAEILMTAIEAFLRERFGDRYGSVPVVLAGDLNNVPGVGVYSLLSSGICHGGTPEEFAKKAKERAAARLARKIEEARKATALAEKMADIRKKNNAVIIAATAVTAAAATPARDSTAAADLALDAGEDETNADTTGVELRGGGVTGGGSRLATVTAGMPSSERGAAVGGTTAAVGDAASAAASDPQFGGVFTQEGGVGGDESEVAEIADGGVTGEGKRAASISSERESRVGFLREYRQGFDGFSSAYGAYSSVFDSQISAGFPTGEASTCEATGQSTIGHVRLGLRGPAANGDVVRHSDGFIEPERGQRASLAGVPVEDKSGGEPQLTTCTDRFAGTLDYIWHTPQLTVRSLLDLPSLKQAMQGGGLPTMGYPSDHLSIMAELQWRRQRRRRPDSGDATTHR